MDLSPLSQPYKRINRSLLYPSFATLLDRLIINCAARGALYVVTSGLRTYAQQKVLWCQGRTTPGPIVTQAKPGESGHNFAINADGARDSDDNLANGCQPLWTPESMAIWAEEAKKLGLDAGAYWTGGFKDYPHVGLNLATMGLTLPLLDAAFQEGGLPAVFELLDAHL